MPHKVYIKSSFRRPVHIFLLVLLIALLSFALVSRAAEYITVRSEIERLGGYYRSIGQLHDYTETDWIITEGVEKISSSKYIAINDHRREAAGVLHGLYNSQLGYNPSNSMAYARYRDVDLNDVWLTGTIVQGDPFYDITRGEYGAYVIRLWVDEVLAGYPEYAAEGDVARVFYFLKSPEDGNQIANDLKAGNRVFVRTYYDPEYFLQLQSQLENAIFHLVLIPMDEDGSLFYPLSPDEKMDFDAPEHAWLKEELELLQTNQRTVLLISTSDMSAMPRVQQSTRDMFLVEGRWLNHDDDLEARKVCVINAQFAEMRGLSIGDTIAMTMRDSIGEAYSFYGYIPGKEGRVGVMEGMDWENWRDFPSEEVSLEIVGIYYEQLYMQRLDWYTWNSVYVFIPNSVMPEGFYGYDDIQEGAHSFVLRSSRDQDAFIKEYSDALADIDIRLSFMESNAVSFWTSVTPIQKSTLMSFMTFSAASLVGLVLAVYVFLRMCRKSLAILRALGTSKKAAGRGLFIHIAMIGLIGILAGGIPSWNYAMGKASETLTAIEHPEGAAPAAALSQWWLILLCAGLFALLLLFSYGGIRLISRSSVISLLQETQGKRIKAARDKKAVALRPAVTHLTNAPYTALPENAKPEDSRQPLVMNRVKKTPDVAFSARFVWRIVYRAPLKSFLVIAFAAGFMLALGWIVQTIERSQAEAELLMSTVTVDMEITKRTPTLSVGGVGSADYGGFIGIRPINKILESGYMQHQEIYSGMVIDYIVPIDDAFNYDAAWKEGLAYEHEFRKDNLRVVGADDPEAYLAFRQINNVEVEWVPKWNLRFFAYPKTAFGVVASATAIILPASLVEQLGIQLGDSLFYLIAVSATGSAKANFTVAGQYNDSHGFNEAFISLSAMEAIHEYWGMRTLYTVAYFTIDPMYNRELANIREQVDEWTGNSAAGLQPLRAVFYDEELRFAIIPLEQTINLLSTLFPAATAVSVLLAMGMSSLLLVMAMRDAAYLRVLGATKRRVRVMLFTQQTILCILGLLFGLIALAVEFGPIATTLRDTIPECAALYLIGVVTSSALSAVIVTRRKPMALLQVKE